MDLGALTAATVAGEPYLGPLTFVLLQLNCEERSAQWTWDAQTLGWSHRTTIDWFYGPSLEHEVHDLPSIESGPWGSWDRLSRTLRVSDDLTWTADVSTAFPCSRLGTTTQVIRLYDAAETLADCAIWGPDADLVTEGDAAWSLPVERPDELLDCRSWQ